jgi:NAD dependent epimerase/dehydratase family enzyme
MHLTYTLYTHEVNVMVLARVSLNEYSNKVLNIIKIKFNLKDKSEAINKFVDLYGDEIVEKEANEEYIKKLIDIEKEHIKKYGNKKLSLKELDELCGV